MEIDLTLQPAVETALHELELDSLNLMAEEINFDQIDEDLATFQEDEMVQQALHRGVDLKKYGKELELELRKVEMDAVTQYVENNAQVVKLHKEMQECDAVLARMQDMLLSFQADLGGISEEIRYLQDASLSMSIRLKNRKAAEEKLHTFIANATLSPDLADKIISPDVNEAFLIAVSSLNDKLNYLHQQSVPMDGSSLSFKPSETHTGRTLVPLLDKLKVKATLKIKRYFTQQFHMIRKPKTNIQMVQQNNIVKFAPLLEFLNSNAKNVFEEMKSLYLESMGRTLHSLFKNYYIQLMKLDPIVVTKNDLIAVEEAMLKSVFTQKVNLTKRTDTFALSDRDKILDQVEAEPILLHVAMAENQKYPIEMILRSVIKHLSDAATNEFLFVLDFFKTNVIEIFGKIFGRTLTLILENLDNYLANCYDVVGLLLMIKVTNLQRLVMQRRRIPVLDPFFDRISMMLWPRLKAVLDANLKSVKLCNARKLGSFDLTPHYVTKRYAELVASMLILNTGDSVGVGGGGENMLNQDLSMLRLEMIGLLERLAALLTTPKERRVFFINNYDQILSVLQERHIVSDEVQKFEDLLMQQRELFAEEETKASFPRLVQFVLQTEQSMTEDQLNGGGKGTGKMITVDETLVENLVRDFAANWRSGIQQINDNVMAYFANFRNGMEILKQVLTQLLLYYTRFQDIIKKSWNRPPPFTRDLVSTATILMEIKRYSRTF